MSVKIIDPVITKNILDEVDIYKITKIINDNQDKLTYDSDYGRMVATDSAIPELNEYLLKLLPIAKKIFGNDSMIPTYILFGHYFGKEANLKKHKNSGFQCMYSLDVCLYYKEPWDIWVEGNPYSLSAGDSLAFNGVHKEHWREAFPSPETNEVGMLFFFYTEEKYKDEII
jgi:hypothetical protein